MQLIKILLSLLLLLIGFYGQGQDTPTDSINYIIKQRTVSKEGDLSHTTISGFAQDAYGFMWMATPDGLNRYDGQAFKVYRKKKSGMQSNKIKQVYSSSDSLLWLIYARDIAKFRAIDIFNPITGKAVPIEEHFSYKLPFEINQLNLNRFNKNEDGTLWFCSQHQLFEYDGQQFKTLIEVPDSLRIELTSKLKNGKGGWITAKTLVQEQGACYRMYLIFFDEAGIIREQTVIKNDCHMVNIKLTHTTIDGSLIYSYAEHDDKDKNSIETNFFKKKQGQAPVIQPFPTTDHSITQLYSPIHQQLWCFKPDGVINVFNATGQIIASTKIQYDGGAIRHYFDTKGNLWLNIGADRDIQIVYTIPNRFRSYTSKDKNSSFGQGSRGIVEDESGNLYLNSRDGSFYSKHRQQEMLRFPPILHYPKGIGGSGASLRLAVMPDSDGSVWLTGEYQVLIRFWPDSQKYDYYFYDSLDHIWMERRLFPNLNWSLFKDKKGRIWIGSAGLSYLDETSGVLRLVKDYNGFDKLGESEVFHFYSNAQGIWLATSSGLYLLDDDMQVRHRYHNKGANGDYLPGAIISHICEDKQGFFWLTTKGEGLVRWNPKTKAYQQFTTENGLKNNVLYAVYEDDYNHLWISSNTGIMRFDKSSHEVKSYMPSDGLPQEEFNTISHYQAKDGTLFFGGTRGMVSFHPKSFDYSNTKEEGSLQIASFSKYDEQQNKNIDLTASSFEKKELFIYPEDRNILLKVALLDYQSSKITYAYKIEGVDQHWHYSRNPEIYLDGLPYGTFTIRIKTEETTEELVIKVKVFAPFYFQTWFILSILFLLVVLVFVIINLRTKAFQKRQKELEEIVSIRTNELEEKTNLLEVQAEDLKALDRLKSRFFANISHELRTPLTLILGPLSILIKEEGKTQSQNKLRTIHRNAKQLLRLVEEILDLSKMDANKLEVHEQPTLLKAFVGRLFNNFESQAKFQDITFLLDIQLESSFKVLLDQDKVEKIINNFLSNALKFTPAQGTIINKVQLKQDKIYFSVEDTGKGISKEDINYLFDRFFQGKEQTSLGGGTGIGLAFSKELAELMGAHIHVESEWGKGSTFTLQLQSKQVNSPVELERHPISESSKTTSEHSELAAQKLNGQAQRILLVEDHQDMQAYIQELLLPHYQVITCSNGQIAYDYLLNNNKPKPDLIVSDVMMPQMDGFTLLKYCKSNDLLRSIPIIMLTARSAMEDKLNALTIGVDDYLVKPFFVDELLVRVKNLLIHAAQRQVETLSEEDSVDDISPENIPSKKNEKQQISELDQNWIKRIENELKEVVDDPEFDVAAFANQLQIGRRSLYRRLKKVVGLTPAEYIRELRLQIARDHLERRSYNTMAEVAYASGFTTPHYFSKIFENRFGRKATSYFNTDDD